MTEELDAETFDIDAWLQDAHLPEDSCVIYKRPDVISELNELRDRIDLEESIEGKTMGDTGELTRLKERYDKALEAFTASRATIYVRAIPESALKEIHAKYPVPAGKRSEAIKSPNAEKQGYAMVAEALVGIQDAGGDRHDVKMSVDQVKALEARIGGSQVNTIRQAWQRAQAQSPEVTVDFLSKRSGTNKDDTND